jgi:hypothetical protein
LPLLVPRIGADDHHDAATPDHPAPIAHLLHGRPDLHLPIPVLGLLFESEHHTASCEVVGRELHLHPVPGQDPDVVHPHLPLDVGQHLVPVLQLHPEHSVREGLDNGPLDLDDVVFRHAPTVSFERVLPFWPDMRTRPPEGARKQYTSDRCEMSTTTALQIISASYLIAVRISGPSSMIAIVCSK